MTQHKQIIFVATARDENNNQYDCSYSISFPLIEGVTQEGLNQAAALAHKWVRESHKNVKVIGQTERIINE